MKNIIGYEGLYKIDKDGNIHSSPLSKHHKPRILKPLVKKSGYTQVCLVKDKIKKHLSVHRLVASHFIPNPSNKPQVNHIDGNKKNNKVSNLEWCTASENKLHAVHVLGHKNSEKQRNSVKKIGYMNARFTEDEASDMCEMIDLFRFILQRNG